MPFSLAGSFVLGRPAADVDATVQENFQQDHQAVLTTLDLSSRAYGLNQLRYDLRKLKGHSLLQRDGSHYAYRLMRSPCSFSSFIKDCADPSLTAAFIINLSPSTDPTAASKPPTFVPTKRSRCSPLRDAGAFQVLHRFC
jgi:hypothetical protein